jgi:hypothetical protein
MNPTMTTRVAAGVTANYLLDLSRDAARTTGSGARGATSRSREHARSADDRATLRRRPTPAHGNRRRGDRAASAPAPAACFASARGFAR